MTTFRIIVFYWLLAIVAFYVVKFLKNKKLSEQGGFANNGNIGKKLLEHLAIWLFFPVAIPFVLVTILIDKIKYKNGPRPIPKKMRKYLKKDLVVDETETNTFISLAEYNYKHGTSFTLDNVYGKGYEASLSEEEKSSITKRNSEIGVLKLGDSLLESSQTIAAIALGNAMLNGDFDEFFSLLDINVETVLYGDKTIVGKDAVFEYWKSWRERYVITKLAKKFEVLHSHYYSNTCLLIDQMVMLFMMNDSKIKQIVLVERHISGVSYSHHDDLVEDRPFDLKNIKPCLSPLREADEYHKPVVKENHLPCFSCGAKSESLDWYSSLIECGVHGYEGIVTICPKCGKVVEYITECRYRYSEPIVDKFDF